MTLSLLSVAPPASVDSASRADSTGIVALDLPLQGIHLIEASAGTGKTWTLAVLVVRLLLAGYQPAQIIATTFTRAAAAELRSRFRLRIQGILGMLDTCLSHPESVDALRQKTSDPLEQYVLNHHPTIDHLAHAYHRLSLALQSLDECFIGTLDSLCQKLLREFGAEAGHIQPLQISGDEAQWHLQVARDFVRHAYTQEDPRWLGYLLANNQLPKVETLLSDIATVSNFPSAPLEPPAYVPCDFDALDALAPLLAELEWDKAAIQTLLDTAAPKKLILGDLAKYGEQLPDMLALLQHYGCAALAQENWQDTYSNLLNAFVSPEENFSTAQSKINQVTPLLNQWLAMPFVPVLRQFSACVQQRERAVTGWRENLRYQLALQLRKTLPQQLASRGETTFSLQMQQLASALTPQTSDPNDPARQLAMQLRHQYPVLLVDEFQDTSPDQDTLIAQVWRHPLRRTANGQPSPLKGCLILVGDPKQAIYGFRGGDVRTYLRAKRDFDPQDIHSLNQNQRSIASLVEAVDQLFSQRSELGEQVEYPTVTAANRPHRQLVDRRVGVTEVAPFRIIFGENKQQATQIASKIRDLLDASHRGQVGWLPANENGHDLDHEPDHESDHEPATADALLTPLQPNDIAVLCSSNNALAEVRQALESQGIPVWYRSRNSVFASDMAYELTLILYAMRHPFQDAVLRRALSTRLLGQTLADLEAMVKDQERWAQWQELFITAGQRWQEEGFLSAWGFLAKAQGCWERLSGLPDAVRHLVNVRHLIELLHAQDGHVAGAEHLLNWLQEKCSLSGDDGIPESEVERRLPEASAVQLMTVHASKGLEFPIVFLMGLDGSYRGGGSGKVFFGQTDTQELQLYFQSDSSVEKTHKIRNASEIHRLVYVALTRASHRLYLYRREKSETLSDKLLQPKKAAEDKAFWLPSVTTSRMTYWLPGDQTSYRGWIKQQAAQQVCSSEKSTTDTKTVSKISPESGSKSLSKAGSKISAKTSSAAPLYAAETADTPVPQARYHAPFQPVTLTAITVSAQPLYGWRTTSFSGLLRTLEFAPVLPSVQDAAELVALELGLSSGSDHDQGTEEIVIVEPWEDIRPAPTATTVHEGESIRWEFPAGAHAGDCLHDLLEHLDFQQSAHWLEAIEQSFERFPVSRRGRGALARTPIVPEEVLPWLHGIMAAFLPEGATLATLPASQRLAEMRFQMAVTEEAAASQAFQAVLARLPAPMRSQQQNSLAHVRYLNGAIDLVYEYQGRYYVADYKSSLLGETLAQYDQAGMRAEMEHHSYWLQALVYQLALHRYLSIRLVDYDPVRHLGGAVYLFLRGMQSGNAQTGVLHWPADLGLIMALDQALQGGVHHV